MAMPLSSTVRCLNRLAARGLPLAAAHQSFSTSSFSIFPAASGSARASIPAFAVPPMPTTPAVPGGAAVPRRPPAPAPLRPSSSAVPSAAHEGNDVPAAMEALSNADAVCFDVDSTVIDEEGIDVLAATLGKGAEVAEWTARAMGGNVKFEDALAARLEIIRPSRGDVAACLEGHPLRLSPGVDRLVGALRGRGTDVFLVSGGFRSMIEPVAERLGLGADRIYANTILFDGNGDYAGFDATEPTSADGGKPKALRTIKERYGYETMVMVGDGATDAQAKPPADAFIGYGGVVTREAVKEKACWFVKDFEAMIEIVEAKQ